MFKYPTTIQMSNKYIINGYTKHTHTNRHRLITNIMCLVMCHTRQQVKPLIPEDVSTQTDGS